MSGANVSPIGRNNHELITRTRHPEKRPPAVSRGLLLVQQGCCLPAGLEAGSATRAVSRAAAKAVTGGDKLDPKRTFAFVVRGGGGFQSRIQAGLRLTR